MEASGISPSMSPADEGSAAAMKRKRQPRNSACQGCASLKMKCIALPNGKCERCNRMERDCLPAVPRPRKRRTESEGVSLLDFAGASSSNAPPPPPKFDPPRGSLPEKKEAEKGSLLARHDLSHTDSQSFISLFSQGLGNVAASEELLRGVDYRLVANSFTIFRQLMPHFPFVELSPGADVISMVARRPVLTLAICTVASGSTPEIQHRLSQVFRYALASKLVLGNERSIDLLTGLLVYIAWNHQYMSQRSVYQDLYSLAGLAADLGLYQFRLEPMNPGSSLERDRAFVGCYYLTCSIAATGYDKPCPLRWTDNLRTCADNVGAAGGLPSDRSLVSLLELVHTLDDMEDALRQDSCNRQTASVPFVDLQVKATAQRLKAMKREYPTLAGSLRYTAASIHIYQRVLRASATSDYSTLIQCACAIKEYLDDVLARPPTLLHQITLIEWTSLVEILVLMARLSRPLPATSGWEAGALASMLQPDTALDSLYAHMSSAPSNDPLLPRHESLLRGLRIICEKIKKSMLQDGNTNRGEEQQLDGTAQDNALERGLDIFNLFGNGVLDSSLWNGSI